MSESSPLAGLTFEQADEAIARLKAKVDEGVGGKAAKEHLAAMKAARKDHTEPYNGVERWAGDTENGGVAVHAQPAKIDTNVKNLGGGE